MDDFMTGLNKAIDEKIETMESPDYEGVPKFSKTSLIASFVCIIISTIAIIVVYNTL